MERWEIIHVPERPPVPANQVTTVDVFASCIEPKLANTLIRRINQIAPLENLRHVKRVRKECLEGGKTQLSVLLCLACDNGNQLESISNDILELINGYQLSPFITKVAKYAAISKEEWQEQCKLWPTSYHPPTYNIDGITGFSEEDSQSIFRFMKIALELTKSGPRCDQVVNAAVIVDPSVRQMLVSACDQICSCHTPIVGTSSVEQPENFTSHQSVANGVTINEVLPLIGSNDRCKQAYTGVSCLYPWSWIKQHAGSTCNWHPLRHAALVAIEHAAARDRRQFPWLHDLQDQSVQIDYLQSPSMSLPTKRQKTNLSKAEDHLIQDSCTNGIHSEAVRPYLCTGFDIYLVWEPCAMCAMALVHQRIRRIFYAFPNSNAGALGSVHRLQGEKSLNHHYAVFKVLLPEEILHKVNAAAS